MTGRGNEKWVPLNIFSNSVQAVEAENAAEGDA
jgi:hypothetical protein